MRKVFAILTFSFLLVGSMSAQIGWTGSMFPVGGGHTLDENTDHTIYIQTWKGGVTDGAGQGAGINCEIYYGSVVNFGDAWTNITSLAMSYNVDVGNNDEYSGALNLPAGKYEYTCRCSDDGGGSWSWQSDGNAQVEFTVVLPVELIDFNVAGNGDDILLSWSTATEVNNDFFTIEKSTDGENFMAIGTVNGTGNSINKVDYDFTDSNPYSGVNYYRLVQTDYDGTTSTSDVVSISLGSKKSTLVSLFPNPVSNNLIVATNIQNRTTVQIFNTRGELVYQGNQELSERIEVDVNDLSAGLYLIRILGDTDEMVHSSSFVKE